jgi:pyruvate kinase
MHAKKTKIVATIGPVTANEKLLTEMVRAGLNVVRLNFSHGDFAEHAPKVEFARLVAQKLDRPVAVMQDLGGPKFRLGEFYQERVKLEAGKLITLTPELITGDEARVSINYPTLAQELKVGSTVMVDDGKKRLEVVEIKGDDVVCEIIVGGETKGRRGVNFPGAYLKVSSLTAKDKQDLEFAFTHNVDMIAFSFVRRPEDVSELREILRQRGSQAMIIAKIETAEAVENLDEIITLADGIMVARGDLAVEVPAEDVPLLQKMIIKKCNKAGKPVITATQMLESMIKSPVPTRAEVSDIANAILDGTDAVMLSEETTLGEHPVEAVRVMSRVAQRVDRDRSYIRRERDFLHNHSVTDAVSNSVVEAATHLGAKYIIALTESGFTARMIARYQPTQNIMALTPSAQTAAQLALSYGCYATVVPKFTTVAEVMELVRTYVLKHKLAKEGDKVLIAAGLPFGRAGDTNMMVVEVI